MTPLLPNGGRSSPLVFLHIPKTAGTTVRHVLATRFARCESLDLNFATRQQEEDARQALSADYLRGYAYIAGHFRYDSIATKLPEARITTFLRDPVDRCLSIFTFLKDRARKGLLAEPERNEIMNRLSLEDFVLSEEDLVRRLRDNAHIRFLGGAVGLPDRDPDEMLRLAKERIAGMECFGLVERMAESLLMISASLGLILPEEIPFINRAPRRNARGDIDGQLIHRIEDTNRHDILLYEFAKNLFEQRWQAFLDELATETWPSWAVGVLREQHLGRARAVNGPLPRSVRLDFSEGLDGWGWYAWDPRGDNRWFRWSGPRAGVGVGIDTSGGVRLRLEAANLLKPDALHRLRVSVCGHPVHMSLAWLPEQPWAILEGYVPHEHLCVSEALIEIVFETPEPLKPRDLLADSEDDRLLGVAVAWLELESE